MPEKLIPFDPKTAKPGDVVHILGNGTMAEFVALDPACPTVAVLRINNIHKYGWAYVKDLLAPAPPEPERRFFCDSIVKRGNESVPCYLLLSQQQLRDTGTPASWDDGVRLDGNEALDVLLELWKTADIDCSAAMAERVEKVLG